MPRRQPRLHLEGKGHRRRRGRLALRRSLYAEQDGLCGICLDPVGFEEATLDHVQPRAVGGPTLPWNLQLAHADCNQAKADTGFHLLMRWETIASGRGAGVSTRLSAGPLPA